jgi:hypothetical protein
MKAFIILISILFCTFSYGQAQSVSDSVLTVIFIRHGEKPEKGSNLSCRGLNRSLQLPQVIKSKFGVPDHVYVPALKMGDKTAHARMFETAIPLAVKYNLAINSKYDEKDSVGVIAEIRQKRGSVLVIWEHSMLAALVHQLGVTEQLNWPGNDYNSIWIVTFKNGKAILTRDIEGLNPTDECP